MCYRILSKFKAQTLSTMSTTTSPSSLPSSFNRFTNHTTDHTYNGVAIYLATKEESATTYSFFKHCEIGVSLSIKMYPVIDFFVIFINTLVRIGISE